MFQPTSKDFWRGIVLYGRNQSTYKLGLAEQLLYYADKNVSKIPLEEFGDRWLSRYAERIKDGAPQGKRRFVDGKEIGITSTERQIELYSQDEISREVAINGIVSDSLEKMVLEKFHTLFKRRIPEPFFEVRDRNLILNNNLLDIANDSQFKDLNKEVLGRWDLLEYGFSKPDSDESLTIIHDDIMDNHGLNANVILKKKRKTLTPLVPVLNGYQHGKCFYCNNDLFDIHVDHVIPWKALKHDEIWNLVLSHEHCNLNKTDFRPPKRFVQKLIDRNESVLKSDLPLKEELKKVLGETPKVRYQKVWESYSLVKDYPIWGGSEEFNPANDDFYRRLLMSLNDSFWERKFGNV